MYDMNRATKTVATVATFLLGALLAIGANVGANDVGTSTGMRVGNSALGMDVRVGKLVEGVEVVGAMLG